MDYQQWTDQLMRRASELGMEKYEVYLQSGQRFSVKLFNGEVDNTSLSKPVGVSLRGIVNGKMGYSYTERLDFDEIDRLVLDCISNAEINESADLPYLYSPEKPQSDTVFYKDTYELSLDNPVAMLEPLKAIEHKIAAYDSRVTMTQSQYGEASSMVMIRNSLGLNVAYESGIGYAYFYPIVKEQDEVKNQHKIELFKRVSDFKGLDTAMSVVQDSIDQFGAMPVQSGTYNVILHGKVMASMLEMMAGCFSADAVDKGLSFLKDKLGELIAADGVDLIDDPALPNGYANVPFDSEGVPTTRKVLIEKGMLTGYLHNLKTAAKFQVPSTGNGFKGSYKSSVGISPTNFYFGSGKLSLEALMDSMEQGLFITDVAGLHAGMNGISGEFSLAASGFVVKSGQRGVPVNQITISGNYYEMLKQIVGFSNDIAFEAMGSNAVYGSPSAFVGQLVIAGQ